MSAYSNGTDSYTNGSIAARVRIFLRLLYPGIGLKRWAAIGAIGVFICSIGMAFLLRKFFALPFPDFLPWYFEGFLMLGVGGGFILLSMYGFYRTLIPFMARSQPIDSLADSIYNRWQRGRGPRIVTIGGGTGLSVLLRGLRQHTDNLTAVITVADDGGSSGRLRRELGVLPPGDFRNCLVAMSEDESLLAELFQYRFEEGDGLKGHSFGNLFIVAMANVTNGFDEALVESSRVLAVRGRVVPATTSNLQLSARFRDGSVVHGESSIAMHRGEIEQLLIEPEEAAAHPLAVRAITDAELVVIGPGSLYSSILPNLMVSGISEAVRNTSATVVYVCNVATQVGETGGYTLAEHVAALRRHTFEGIADYVVGNSNPPDIGDRFEGDGVVHDGSPLKNTTILLSDLVDDSHPVRHDSDKLADAIMQIHGASDGRISAIASEK